MLYNQLVADASIKTLNPEQLQAVQHGEGPLLIIAGAGTGKTTVITERIKHLIVKKKVSPSEILALTFTEKAAREMEERVDIALPLGYANMWISTFHGFADRVLRDEALNIGLNPHYRIMTQAENVHFLRRNLFKLDLDYFRPLGNPNKFVEGLLQHFSRLKDEDVAVEEYFQYLEKIKKEKKLGKNKKLKENNEDLEEISRTEELAKTYQKYEELKFQEGFLDFGDLMSQLLRLFRTRPKILKTYQEKFKYILVDEFQDTNYAQYVLIKLLAPPPKSNLTVVGDDNQSIYKFRGAAISNILQFKKDYPKTQSVVLNQNYRSSQTILDAAYRLIKNNDPDTLEASLGISKKLEKVREVTEVPVEFLPANRVDNEAERVAKEIKKLLEEGYQYRDFAILVRANNHAEPFIQALAQAGMPAQFLGPGMLFREPEIKDLIAYLSVLYNFEDTIAMYRLLSMEHFALHGRDLAALLNFSRKRRISLFEACEETVATESTTISPAARETIGKLVKLIHKHLDLMKTASAYEILLLFLQDSGLYGHLSEIKTIEDEKKVQNIAKFFDKLKVYETGHEDASVLAVVDYINLSLELGESPLVAETDWTENNAVNLLTVHSAKGLEFPVVFLVNLVNRRFPPTERREPIPIPEVLIKEILPQGDYHLEEERRLFYVGMTRAKNRLYFTAANFYGEGKQERKVSQFVVEVLGQDTILKTESAEKDSQLSIFDFKTVEVKRGPMVRQPISQLSYSQIETFDLCPLKYRFAYILFLPTPPSGALSFGSAIHETLRDFYQRAIAGQKPTKEDLLKILVENWISVGYSSREQQARYKKQGEKILSEYFEKTYQPKALPLILEQSFALRIGPSLRVLGKIDRIDQDGEKIEIIDYKTGKSPTKKEVGKDLQLSLYALVAVEGILTQAGILKQIPKPDEVTVSFYFFDNQEKISGTRTKEDLERVKGELLEKAKAISESSFSPTPGKHCDFCEFRLLCEAWK
jgi:DNA helicase-2/ATP-dependent DNA helicase PcrA